MARKESNRRHLTSRKRRQGEDTVINAAVLIEQLKRKIKADPERALNCQGEISLERAQTLINTMPAIPWMTGLHATQHQSVRLP